MYRVCLLWASLPEIKTIDWLIDWLTDDVVKDKSQGSVATHFSHIFYKFIAESASEDIVKSDRWTFGKVTGKRMTLWKWNYLRNGAR